MSQELLDTVDDAYCLEAVTAHINSVWWLIYDRRRKATVSQLSNCKGQINVGAQPLRRCNSGTLWQLAQSTLRTTRAQTPSVRGPI